MQKSKNEQKRPQPPPQKRVHQQPNILSEWHLGQEHADAALDQKARCICLVPFAEADVQDRNVRLHEKTRCGCNSSVVYQHIFDLNLRQPMKKNEVYDEKNSLGQESSCSSSEPDPDRDVQIVSPFNQLEYLEYQNWQRSRDMKSAVDATAATGKKIELRTDFTDEEVCTKMFEKFGEMDTSSPRYSKIFATFKESMLEEAAELSALANGSKSPDYSEIAVEEMKRQVFTKEKIDLYGNLNPKTNKSRADWLDLPRPIKKMGLKTLESTVLAMINLKLKEEYYSNQGEQKNKSDNQVNLAVFDPKYWNFPNNVSNCNEGYEDTFTPLALCHKLNVLIHQNPIGLSINAMGAYFHRKTGYRITVQNENYDGELEESELEVLFSSLEDIFYVMDPVKTIRKPLLFPAAFKGLIANRQVFDMRITHFIVLAVTLEKEGFFKLDTVVGLVWKHFNIRLDPLELGYNSTLDFFNDYTYSVADYLEIVTYLHKKDESFDNLFGQDGSYYVGSFLIVKSFPNASEDFQQYRLRTEQPESTTAECLRLQQLELAEKYEHQFLFGVPRPIIGKLEEMKFANDVLVPDQVLFCRCLQVYSPSSFYVMAEVDVEILETLQIRLLEDDWKLGRAWNFLDELTIQSLVLVKTTVKNKIDWRRGVVLQIKKPSVSKAKEDEGTKKLWMIKVRQIDYGSVIWATEDQIAPIPEEFGNSLMALGIHCHLHFDDPEFAKKEKKETWTPEERQIFRNLVSGTSLHLRFGGAVHLRMSKPHAKDKTTIECEHSSEEPVSFPSQAELFLPFRDVRLRTVAKAAVVEAMDDAFDNDEFDDNPLRQNHDDLVKIIIPDVALEFDDNPLRQNHDDLVKIIIPDVALEFQKLCQKNTD